MKERGRLATDSLILAFVQGMTVVTGLVQSMLLARFLTHNEYGTYSQGILVINFVIPFSLLGLSNAINYFYNGKGNESRKYIDTIMGIITILGVLGAICVLASSKYIVAYFDNAELSKIMGYVAIRPLLQNILSAYIPLYISTGRTRVIALRNLIISVMQVAIIAIATLLFHDIVYIFAALIMMDIIQIIIFALYFTKREFCIKFYRLDASIIKPIFAYTIPLAISTMIGTISINMDKLLIGKMMSTENFAVFSLMSKELPFNFFISSFTTVVTPAIIACAANHKKQELVSIWGNYIEVGYKVTWMLVSGAVICAPELLTFLYSDSYMEGLPVFVVYLLVAAIRFTYFGMILSAYGKTKFIMWSSVLTLVLNLILNSSFYNIFGMIGPALASLGVISVMGAVQLLYSSKIAGCNVMDILGGKRFVKFVLTLMIVGIAVYILKSILVLPSMVKLILCFGLNASILAILNYKEILSNIRVLNGKE